MKNIIATFCFLLCSTFAFANNSSEEISKESKLNPIKPQTLVFCNNSMSVRDTEDIAFGFAFFCACNQNLSCTLDILAEVNEE